MHILMSIGDAYSPCGQDGDLAVNATAAAPSTVLKKGPKQAKSTEDGVPLTFERDSPSRPFDGSNT